MGKHLAPLVTFVGGNLILLIGFLFLGAIGTAGETLAENTTAIVGTFPFMEWAISNVKFLVFMVMEMMVLFATAKAFVKTR